MCGILAEFTFNGQSSSDSDQFETLLALSRHRGPDNSQIEKHQNYQLGFNRLSVIDLSEKGNQPIFSPSKRFHLVCNGEIYNFENLIEKHQLENLRSTSDTEVLAHLLDRIGVDNTLKELNGMFALAVVDTISKEFYLARDFAGIKPLFYGISDKGIVAASQFDQIFRHDWFKNDLNLRIEIMKENFAFGYMHAPNTIYENIFQLQPNEALMVSTSGNIEKYKFGSFNWILEKNLEDDTDHFDSELIEICLNAAVKRQLVSDVPLASFLSGGIDSPLISAIAKKKFPEIEAFTVAVDDKEMNEDEAASAYARHLNLSHKIYHVNEKDLLNIIDDHFRNCPEPFGDYSSIPTYMITRKARILNTVMLSGDGGDELFFGYPRMADVLKKRHWFKLPFSIRRPLIRLTNKLKITNTWAPYHFEHIDQLVLEKHTHIKTLELERMFPDLDFSKEIRSLYTGKNLNSKKQILRWLRYNEFYGHLQRILIKVDRMSMANSLEVRVPFLDKNLIEKSLLYCPSHLSKKSDLKRILKDLMKHYYPEKIINQKKLGFTVPIDRWLRHQLKEDLEQCLLEKPIYGSNDTNDKVIKHYIQRFLNYEHQWAWGVWHIYAWQKWAIIQRLI